MTRPLRIGEKKGDRELPVLKETPDMPDLGMIEKAVDGGIQTDKKLARPVKLYICHCYSCYSGRRLREIGERLGVTDSGVSQASKRIDEKQKTDKKLKRHKDLKKS
jgi:hypothetical protein